MEASTLLQHLRDMGVSLWLEGGRIEYETPKGVMTDKLIEECRQHKPEIINLLLRSSPISHEPESLPIDAAQRQTEACRRCDGKNLVIDQAGAYCVDCKRRPDVEPAQPAPEPKSSQSIGVRWGSEKGWIALRNPLTGKWTEIKTKGAPRWVFDRLKNK